MVSLIIYLGIPETIDGRWQVFLIAVPLEVLTILWYILFMHPRKRRAKSKS
jgi:hypothetical protein